MKLEAKLYLEKAGNEYPWGSMPYRVRCKYRVNGEETFDQVLVPNTTETEGSYIIELLEQGKSLGDIHDMLHGV